MKRKIKMLVPVEKKTVLVRKKTVFEERRVVVDERTYRKIKREFSRRPYGLSEMLFYDFIFDD